MSHRTMSDKQDGEPPIVDLSQVRQERRRKQEEEATAAAAAIEQRFREQHDQQRVTLQTMLLERRMLFSDFQDMIKLGIITDEEDHLPCVQHSRDTAYGTWEQAYYSEDVADPDADLVEEVLQRLRQGGVAEADLERLAETQKTEVPAPNKVYCPMLAYAEGEDPPCAHALNTRQVTRWEDGAMRFYRVKPDPEDVVLKTHLIPCVFLGRELFRSVMPAVWLAADEGQDEEVEEEEEEDGEEEQEEDDLEEEEEEEDPE